MFRAVAVCLCVVFSACGSTAMPPAAKAVDLVLSGGRIFTADPARPWAEALAVRGDRIVAVGTTREVHALRGVTERTRVIELGGRVVIPGLNDAHSHAPGIWKPHVVRYTTRSPSLDDTVAAARDAASEVSPGAWILVPLGSDAYDDPRATRALLDEVTTQHPVMAYDRAGHAKLLNSAALKALRISDQQADPPHGRYGRARGTGRLNGWLYEYAAFRAVTKLEGAHDDATVAKATDAAERDAVAYGLTSLQSMPAVGAARFVRAQATRTPRLRWRVIHWPRMHEVEPQIPAVPAGAASRVRVAGVKYILDGTPLERWAWRSRPYLDRPDHRGAGNFTTAELQRIVEEVDASGEQLLVHAVGDAAIDQILAILEEKGGAARWRARRVRIEHGDMMTPRQIQRAAALGMILVQNAAHFLGPRVKRERMGDCGSVCQPLASALRGGLAIALGSDGPLNPFIGIRAATLHPTSPSEALTREQAVIAYTRGAAFAEGMEHEKGMLAVGMLADLAVLDADIFTIPADRLPATKAWLTLVGGEIVHDARSAPPQ